MAQRLWGRSQFFTERVINVCNSLPCDVVDFFTISAFKHRLEMVDLSKFYSVVQFLLCCVAFVECNAIVFFTFLFYFSVLVFFLKGSG